MSEKLNYNGNYLMRFELQYEQVAQAETVSPAAESSYSKKEWDALTLAEQQQWLNEETREWAMGFVEYGWEVV